MTFEETFKHLSEAPINGEHILVNSPQNLVAGEEMWFQSYYDEEDRYWAGFGDSSGIIVFWPYEDDDTFTYINTESDK